MLLCPRCTTGLVAEKTPAGRTFACPTCRGMAATVPVLRKRFDETAVSALWARVRTSTLDGKLRCPSCSHAMKPAEIPTSRGPQTVDACHGCLMVWLDAKEVAALPAAPPPPRVDDRLTDEAAEAYGRFRLEEEQNRVVVPVEAWSEQGLAHLAGVPRLGRAPEPEHAPWVVGILTVLILLLHAGLAVFGLVRDGWDAFYRPHDAAVAAWGFVPADFWRHGGLTLVSSFFLHAYFLHVLLNAYFLQLAGRPVEGLLGSWRTLGLLLVATVAGNLLHAALHPASTTPAVGASGGIAGLFAVCALALPRVHLGLTLGWWTSRNPHLAEIRLPVRWVFGAWFVFEFLRMFRPGSGVAHGAHVGGALAGALWWWFLERARPAPAAAEPPPARERP